MRADYLFTEAGTDVWGLQERRLNLDLLDAIRTGTQQGATDAEAALVLAEQIHADLMAYGTGGGEELTEVQMRPALRALTAVCERLGVPLRVPFRDYTTFRSYWLREGASGSWQARRDIVGGLLDPAIEALTSLTEHPHEHVIPDVALNALTDASAIHDSLKRMARAVDTDPRLAVSTAKDLIESTAKLVLAELSEPFSDSEDLPALAAHAQRCLGLTKKDMDGRSADETAALSKLLGSLNGLVQGIAELRNRAGTGHGRAAVPAWVQPRHARLASGAATTWCSLMLETLGDPQAPWRTAPRAQT